MKCALYLRYSPRSEQLCESLEFQEDFVRAYCEFTKLDVGPVIKDPETSARLVPLHKRRGGAELLRLTTGKCPDIRHVVAYRIDRIFRSVVDGNITLNRWRKSGVACHFAAEGGQSLNTETATGRFIVNMLLAKSEYEPDLTSERTSTAMARYMANGRAMGGSPPYGKKLGPLVDVGNGVMRPTWEDDPEEQAIVERILRWHAGGWAQRRIAAELNHLKIPSRGKAWGHNTIKRIIVRQPIDLTSGASAVAE